MAMSKTGNPTGPNRRNRPRPLRKEDHAAHPRGKSNPAQLCVELLNRLRLITSLAVCRAQQPSYVNCHRKAVALCIDPLDLHRDAVFDAAPRVFFALRIALHLCGQDQTIVRAESAPALSAASGAGPAVSRFG